MTRTIRSVLAIGAMLTASGGAPAAGQTVKRDFTYQHNQSDIAMKQQQPGAAIVGNRVSKPQPKALKGQQHKQRLYPASGCPLCSIKKD